MARSSGVDVIGLPGILKRNKAYLSRVGIEVERELQVAAERTVNRAREKVPVDTGNLRANIRVERPREYQRVVHTGEAEYAPYVEFGTGPHFPPIAPLRRWAYHKLGDERAAYAIARAIARAGTEAQPFMRPSFQEEAPRLKVRLREIAKRVSGR